jgi:hypothetical protein
MSSASVRANDDNNNNDDDRVSLGIAVTERDGRLIVAHVIRDLPADEAGVKRGDQIRKVDGERVRNAREFMSKLEDKQEGDEIELEVVRDGDSKTFDIELATYREMREAAQEDDEYRRRVGQAVGQVRGQIQQMRGQQAGGQELQQLRQQVQDLQRQVRQMQTQLQQRDGQRFDQQRGPQQQYGQQWDDRRPQPYGQQWDDQRQQQYGQQWDDRGFGQREAGRQQQYRSTPFR